MDISSQLRKACISAGFTQKELAEIDSEPFTTSDVIAECAQVRHHAIQQLIARYESDLKEFGVLAFEMRTVKTNLTKVYHLNEPQASRV